eukprot:TRINITY_DN3490_c0_g1_i1.p1 TRINITY_DN3490_c0_g1~~TRINITY_DN3490_c0_g1_i1.p1  ORF type:complete len:1202 (+),score=172.50 TRINITY_DN3490_c0_g1_i1:33-3638(+)
MRVLLLLCATLFVAACGQPILPTQRMALGLSYEPESGCVFIIFLERVKVHCHPTDGAAAREVVSPDFLGGRSIVRFTGKTDSNGYLFLLAQDTNTPSNETQLFLVSKNTTPKWVNSTSVSIGASGVSANKRTDFHLTTARNELFFVGQVNGQAYGLYSYNSTASGSTPVLAMALERPAGSPIREPMFAEHSGYTGFFFRGFAVSSSLPSIFVFDLSSRTGSAISFQTSQISASTLDVYGPLVIRTSSGPTTVGWIAHQTNGTHYFLTDCVYNSSALPANLCRATSIVLSARPLFKGAASSTTIMYLFSASSYYYFPRTGNAVTRSASGSVVEVAHDGELTSNVFLVSRDQSFNIGVPRSNGFVSSAAPDGLSALVAVANNTYFFAAADPLSSDTAFVASMNPDDTPPSIVSQTSLITCSDGRSVPIAFGVASIYIPAPANLFALVSVFESGAFLKYFNSRLLDAAVASVPLFSPAISSSSDRQPVDVLLAAKLTENKLLLSASIATYDHSGLYSGLMLVTRQNGSSPFSATMVARQGDTQCVSNFNSNFIASSVAPTGRYVIFTDTFEIYKLGAYYLDLSNASAVAVRLLEFGTSTPLFWTTNSLFDPKDLPVVHLEGDQYCLIANSTNNRIFCFQGPDPIKSVDFSQPNSLPDRVDYAAGKVSESSLYRILNYVCATDGGFGVCTYRPFDLGTTTSPRVSSGLIGIIETYNSIVAYPTEAAAYELSEFVNGTVTIAANTTSGPAYAGGGPVPEGSVYGKFVLQGDDGVQYFFDRCITATECYRTLTCSNCSLVGGGTFSLCGVANKGAALAQSVSNTDIEIVYASVTGKLVSLLRMVEADFVGCRVVSSDPAVVVIVGRTSVQAILADRVVEVSRQNSTLQYDLQVNPYLKSVEFVDGGYGKQILASLTRVEETRGSLEQNDNVALLPFNFCSADSQCPSGQNCSYGVCSDFLSPPTPVCAPPQPPNSVCINGVWYVPRNVTNNGTVATIPGATIITGSLISSGNGTLIFTDGAQLNVSGCASFSGNLQLVLNAPATSGDQVVEVINFDGYCGGTGTQFDTAQITVKGGDPCASSTIKNVQYTSKSLTVVFSYDTSNCYVAPDGSVLPITPSTAAGTPANPGGNNGVGGNDLGGLGIGGIVGIVVAVVVVAVAIMLLSIFWGRFRRAIRPYEAARHTKEEARRRETKEEADSVPVAGENA